MFLFLDTIAVNLKEMFQECGTVLSDMSLKRRSFGTVLFDMSLTVMYGLEMSIQKCSPRMLVIVSAV